MKKTINHLRNIQVLLLKSIAAIILLTTFTPAFGQVKDPPGFNAEKARQEAVQKGVNADEIEAYVIRTKNYFQHIENIKKFGGTTITIPKKVIERKAGGGPTCVGDFENGTVNPWTGYTSINTGLNTFINNTASFTTGVVTGRHTIMSPGTDPHVSSINTVHSGSYSLRLGDDVVTNGSAGGYAERVARTVTVTGNCLTFWYALIFQNGHPTIPNDQPFFMFRLFDSTGNLLDSFVKVASNNPFFTQQPNTGIAYRDWTQYTVDLGCGYEGKTVTIEFTNADCSQGGHYGYTYIDDVCFDDCMSCCDNCDELFNYPGSMSSYPVITKSNSTDSTCCFKFNFIFDPDIFRCDPYGVKVYKDGDTSVVYSSYSRDSGLVYESHFYNTSVLDFCVRTASFTTPLTVRVAFYNKNGELICDTIKQTLNPCCRTCDDIINLPELYTTYPLLVYTGSTDNSCCYRTNFPFLIAQVFKCGIYGVKVYEEGHAGSPVSSYQSTTPIGNWGFNQSLLDFCLNKSTFTTPKTFVIALYDSAGNLLCDSLKRTIDPCYSSSGCNCGNLFSNPNFTQVSTIKKDTSTHYSGVCCFTFTPFRDSSTIKCPYYGFRIYKDSNAQYSSYNYLDTVNPSTPIGGPGAPPSSDTFKFCLNNYLFDNGPVSLRIEYLDSQGRVICSKVEKVSCESSCCESVNYYIRKDTTETDPNKCCYRIEVWASCSKTFTAELMKDTGGGWSIAGRDTFSITRPIFFDVCSNNGDTARYMVFIKDSTGKVICSKEIKQSCPNCCDIVAYTATYVAPVSPYIDQCCWDINVYPAASQECNIWHWKVYDSLQHVPSTYPPFGSPSTVYQGRHCTPIIQAPNPAPGTIIVITYCITRYLAVYDNNGRILCIKPIKLCCTRTYQGRPDPPCCTPQNLQVAPNPFSELFTMSMELTQEMPVSVTIVNSTGANVFTHDYGMQSQGLLTKEINLAGLPSGIYMLSVNNGQASVQIVKQ